MSRVDEQPPLRTLTCKYLLVPALAFEIRHENGHTLILYKYACEKLFRNHLYLTVDNRVVLIYNLQLLSYWQPTHAYLLSVFFFYRNNPVTDF